MSLDTIGPAHLAPYEDEEEILLMDMDETNLQLEEQQLVNAITNVVNKEKEKVEINENDDVQNEDEEEEEEEDETPLLLVIEKLKVYIRDGPDRHHVETISTDEKYYDLPTDEELASIEVTKEQIKDIWKSLNLVEKDFRASSSPGGSSRPESLYVRGVTNMSTQKILNYFEEFKPTGIEWISDHSCNVFWRDALSPIHLLAAISTPGPSITHRRPVNYDHAMRLSKQKAPSSPPTNTENESVDIALPPGHWREANFELADKPTSAIKLYLRYTTLADRKVRGAENQSEYYRQHGNPNYNNMTGLISRSKKRELNAMKPNHFRDFTVVKSNDPTSTSTSIVEEATIASEDNPTDDKVKFTVVLPPKKASPSKEDEEDNEVEEHRAKRQRRRRSSDDDDGDQQRKEKTHFTVTIDPVSKHTKDSKTKAKETPTTNADNDDDVAPVTDARQILERMRRNRK